MSDYDSEFNGCSGIVTKFNEATNVYIVQITSGEHINEQLSMTARNLRVIKQAPVLPPQEGGSRKKKLLKREKLSQRNRKP